MLNFGGILNGRKEKEKVSKSLLGGHSLFLINFQLRMANNQKQLKGGGHGHKTPNILYWVN